MPHSFLFWYGVRMGFEEEWDELCGGHAKWIAKVSLVTGRNEPFKCDTF